MSEKETVQIPYFVHEGEMARQDRTIKKLWIALLVVFLVLTAALIGTNVWWMNYESQYETEVYSYDVQQDTGDGDNTYTGNTISMNSGGSSHGETEDNLYGETEIQEDPTGYQREENLP